MRAHLVRGIAVTLATVTLASAAGAQATSTGPGMSVTPYAGYIVFGNYLNGPLGTSLSSASGAVYGIQASVDFTPSVSLLANVGRGNSNLQVGVPFLGGINVGQGDVLLYDADLELRLPSSPGQQRTLAPFLQVGAGQVRYDLNVSLLSTQATNFAANGGVGVDLNLGRQFALRFMAKDYVGKFNFQQAAHLDVQGETAHNWVFSSGLKVAF
ncbi:MAG TPA: outer membrane beta-barrel protein [Gemmatimonadaceae bacterium]|jgi:hypothetical protein|nr:outer membrane beta-barrel protein [Gemmatimonadaceae bacterium]